ncbi:branched-chain-amino-acid aminotransferase [Marivirga tractuosa]|uniref:branched-chain-amino-acid transaminase n=1 Tax=Marivirga tractuosa (strain ATCC 23168 / DSM 4126 / NBRC 15989 / NCIMB 1408 / VKM B-1430 / H-43) TaxID=643867 RepID=E4TTM4_MARTH|nr:branched-chain amino acid aminotransferase [Marivirga tractuosa]ADR20941.1 branched chain amino acid aminotransferase apoenzyme [Marivirga tractuosa DSM 4126]BDD14608.1 branched-chain-amino-acid aminotransferase [Marivirga tractuosa]
MLDTLDISIRKVQNSRINEVDFNNIPFGKVYSDHMFIADYEDGQWSDLRIVPYENLSMAPASSVIHYGQSVFEGLKAYKNSNGEAVVFRPEANAKRLNKSAERMCIPEVPEELFIQAMTELLNLDKDWIPNKENTALYIRPFVFAMDDYIGIKPSEKYRFMIITCPVGAYYSEPVKVKIETEFTRAAKGGTGYAKAAGNYAGSLYPAKLAQKQGYHQLVWTDASEHKYIEESGTMNIMFVINDTLITPEASSTILRGITRDSVLTLARDWGMKVEERKVSIKEVVDAAKNGTLQEAFGAGTAATIAHIKLIGHEGVDYQLPAIEEREFSNKVLKAMDAIKLGEAEDKFEWIYKL